MDEVEVRRAAAGDADALAAVYRSAYRENRRLGFPAKAESASKRTVADWVRDHTVLVATLDGWVVGGVRLEETAPDRAKVSRLAVHEDCKGAGVGSRLLDRAHGTLRDCGYDVVWLTTPEGHPYLPELYRRRGFEVTEPYSLDYRDYDEVVMEKRL